jgi:hypothetical protein
MKIQADIKTQRARLISRRTPAHAAIREMACAAKSRPPLGMKCRSVGDPENTRPERQGFSMNARAMERNDEQQIDFSKDVMHRGDRRDDDARCIAVHRLHTENLKSILLVVSFSPNKPAI